MCGLIKSKLCIIVHRVHKWRIQSVNIKYLFLVHSLFKSSLWNVVSAVRFFIWMSGRILKVHVFEVVSTSILAITVAGAHQVGETGAGVMLPFPWIWHLKVGKGGGIIWQFKSFISWQVELQVCKGCSLKVWIQIRMWCFSAELIVAISRWPNWCMALIARFTVKKINSLCSYQQLF